MARSPLTLAATVTSAWPGANVVDVRALSENAAGRFDSAVASLADGSRVVVRVATDADASAELDAEARALTALTSGVRALLPFRAPVLHGRATQDGHTAVVVDFLDGYRVDAAHVPSGRGVATSLGSAIAAVHALPESVARAEDLPQRTAAQARDDVSRLLDRVAASHRVPVSLLSRWSRALASDRLWRFEPVLTLGGTTADAFVFENRLGIPTVTGLLSWQGLSVGDPALDVRWLSSAPEGAEDVLNAYLAGSVRTPDAALRIRARLYAELEFAKWLVHGHEIGDDGIVDDAEGLLTSLADTVVDDDLLAEDDLDVDEAIALIGRLAAPSASDVDTSMQTDAYDASDTSFFADDGIVGDDSADASDQEATAPLQFSAWVADGADDDDTAQRDPDAAEAGRAAEAALRRWASS
ncbi:aminoglycoside phosphotransferase [Microbacterium protaetiae]|uniref:Aminoglycoside phosphotransferase n=1 Tax=Microbacterium protaetiae TaxID=2509458 RepID=A0A4P6ESS8_9MICO|nr:phosphotransferase [Microbacterium protaetiae]QAY61038.1 aminoglycoside phosphotransferase [Microbacterium protaetiae]